MYAPPAGSIQFERTYELIEYNDFQQILHYNAGTVDPIDGNQDHLVTDHDPQSCGSHGTVYDLDAPWLGTGNYPSGTVLRKRANLIEDAYIYIGLNKLQVSGKFNWFTRLSVYKSGNGTDVLEQTYPTDNMVGTGLTKLSYNLQ